jgi:predicted aconitase/predicted aconitase with swiveling domain
VLRLNSDEQAMLAGEGTRAEQIAMEMVARLASITGARALIPISRAHIDGCLYHGQASVDFADLMASAGGQVRVPTTLNVGIIDLLHPELFRGDPAVAAAGREMMAHYRAMGCRQTWTCAPYQLTERPVLGEQIAWAESNAIVFANSALGARTERYGDFIDLAAAITGRVPDVGLHRDEGRRATVLINVRGISTARLESDLFFAALGHIVGRRVGTDIPVIDGVPHATEDQLKAFGAAAASAGAVAMFHMAGVTPEAPDLPTALGGRSPARVIEIGPRELAGAVDELSPATTQRLGAISVGTPHFSFEEFRRATGLLTGRRIADSIEFYVSTGRDVLSRVDTEGWGDALRASGVRIVTDTCTYLTPILRERPGAVMTNSAKWAWYAPGNLGYDVIFASLEECIESAVAGDVVRMESAWEHTPGDVGSQRPFAAEQLYSSVDLALSPNAAAKPSPSGSSPAVNSGVCITGSAEGDVLSLGEPLSFWGGVREHDGSIIDVHHPQHGSCVADRIVVMPGGRGSSSSSSVLAELIRGGVAPAGIVLGTSDPILALGAMVGEVLYQRTVPIVVLSPEAFAHAAASRRLRIDGEHVRAV